MSAVVTWLHRDI